MDKVSDWPSLYAELMGYLQAAAKDDAPVDAGELLVYLGELRTRYARMSLQEFNVRALFELPL